MAADGGPVVESCLRMMAAFVPQVSGFVPLLLVESSAFLDCLLGGAVGRAMLRMMAADGGLYSRACFRILTI